MTLFERGEVQAVPISGSVSSVRLKRCVKEKLDTMVLDEAGLKRPIIVSVIIPTKIDVGRKTRRRELETLGRVLRECSALADLGYVDEIVVIDASVDKLGEPDYSVLNKVVKTAYLHLDLFKREVDLINSSKAEALHASRGFFDFFVKVVHQFDPNISKLLLFYEAFNSPKLKKVPSGKGAALWLSVPLVKGDVVCFLDSDIMNYKKEMVVALCHPLIKTFTDPRSRLEMVKAFYKRLTLRYESPRKHYVLGGRITRLFAIPFIKVMAKNYPRVFGGLDTILYPLAGESAITRETLETLEFTYDYSIEVAILHQIANKYGLEALSQVDLDLFYHIGQSAKELQNMVGQITTYLFSILEEEGIHLTQDDIHKIIKQYIKEARHMIKLNRRILNRLKKMVGRQLEHPIYYSKSTDESTLRRFALIIKEAVKNPPPKTKLQPWRETMSRINYLSLSTLLKRRANQSTYSRLMAADLLPKMKAKRRLRIKVT
jgi:hypothetical protein